MGKIKDGVQCDMCGDTVERKTIVSTEDMAVCAECVKYAYESVRPPTLKVMWRKQARVCAVTRRQHDLWDVVLSEIETLREENAALKERVKALEDQFITTIDHASPDGDMTVTSLWHD